MLTNQYQYRVKYSDKGTGEVMKTGLCRDLNDAMLKAAMLGGVIIDDDGDEVNVRQERSA